MKVIQKPYNKINIDEPIAVAIGNFDGVHLGHMQLINEVLDLNCPCKKGIITFNPHTMEFFTGDSFRRITTVKMKEDLIKKLGFDYLISVKFTKEFSNLSVRQFIKFLKDLNVKKIVVGADFRFGFKGQGKPKDLANDFELVVVPDVILNNQVISSTTIKDYIQSGKLEKAREMLGYNYKIRAEVIHGNKVGSKKLGFPTANLDYDHLVLPPNGVYYTKVYYNGKIYGGMTNIGHNPTVNFSEDRKLEVHILDFNKDIYYEEIEIEFIEFLRKEQKFKSKDQLIGQLKQDLDTIKHLFNQ